MADGDVVRSPPSKAEQLRQVFNGKYNVQEFLEKDLYDQRNVDKLKEDDRFVEQFIRSWETLEDAANRIHETLKWRKETKMNDLTESTFERWIYDVGAIFYHSHDKDGRKILFIKVKEHKRDAEKLPYAKLFLAFHFEMAYRENPEQEIVVLFDMMNTGMANLDMELIKFVITSFKIYYPTLLGYLLVFEMPWLFNAAWRVIKSWLSPQAVNKLKFVSKKDVQEYIDKDKLLEHMGGTDPFVFKYIPPEEREKEDESATATKKKVTFAEHDSTLFKSFSGELPTNFSPRNLSLRKSGSRSKSSKMESGADNSFIGRLLTISPAEELEFKTGDNDREIYDVISLKNTLPYPIAYKVKTTSPEKYKVRPSSGIVKPGSTVEVYVYLLSASTTSISKDKFLIMAMELTTESVENISEKWKGVSNESIMEHKLRCVLTNKSGQRQGSASASSSQNDALASMSKKVDELMERSCRLEKMVKGLLVLQVVLLILLVVVLYTTYSNALQSTVQANTSFCGGALW